MLQKAIYYFLIFPFVHLIIHKYFLYITLNILSKLFINMINKLINDYI